MAKKKRPPKPNPGKTLRERAEELLRAKPAESPSLATEDVQALVHELNVHQIELEIQNEELRHAQLELGHARDRYADLYEFAPVGYVTLDKEGRILEANLTASTMLDIERRKLLGTNLTKFIAPDSQDDFYLHRRAALSAAEDSEDAKQICELQMNGAGGPFTARLESIPFGEGDDRKCRAALIDVTDQKQAQEALKKLNVDLNQSLVDRTTQLQENVDRVALLSEAVANLPEGVLITDGELDWPDPHITFVNDAMCAISGYSREELIGNTPRVMQSEKADRRALDRLKRELAAGRSYTAEMVYYRKDGSPYDAEQIVSPLFDEEGRRTNFVAIHRDITERKQAERALRESRERLRLAQVVANVGCFDWHFESQSAECTEGYFRLYGLEPSAEPLTFEIWRERVHPDDREIAVETARRAVEAGTPYSHEFRVVWPDGSVHWLAAKGSVFRDESGKPIRMLGVNFDVTQRKQAEVELRDREARLRAILNAAADAFITIDQRGVIEAVNPAAERMFGYARDEMVGQNVTMLMPPPYADEHDGYLARYVETRNARIIGVGRELIALRKDGTVFPIDLTISEIEHLGMFSGIIRDITERNETREAARREHELAESVINTAAAIILLLDTDGRIVRFNPYMERLSGYTLAEVQGKDWFETFLPERDRGRIRELFQESLRNHTVEGNMNPIVTKGGEEREIAWWATTLKDADGEVVALLSVGQDITELRKAQQQLVQAERLSAIGEAMAGLTHESRNALARSQANLRRLGRRVGDEPEFHDLIEAAIVAQNDIRHLFEEVRQYAAPMTLRAEPTDIRQLVEEAWEQLDTDREGREVELILPKGDIDSQCEVDEFTIRNAFRNLFENALAACEDPVEIDTEFFEATIAKRPALKVAIRDNGPGLPPEVKQRVFDAFFTTKTRGSGLGLAIVKRAVEEHGGRVDVVSRDGAGAEFHLTLPRTQ